MQVIKIGIENCSVSKCLTLDKTFHMAFLQASCTPSLLSCIIPSSALSQYINLYFLSGAGMILSTAKQSLENATLFDPSLEYTVAPALLQNDSIYTLGIGSSCECDIYDGPNNAIYEAPNKEYDIHILGKHPFPPPSPWIPPPSPPNTSSWHLTSTVGNWCGTSHPGQAGYSDEIGLPYGGNWGYSTKDGYRFCKLSLASCQAACVDMGGCAELSVAPNGCCFPARSVCYGNRRVNDHKYVRINALTTLPPSPSSPSSVWNATVTAGHWCGTSHPGQAEYTDEIGLPYGGNWGYSTKDGY